MLIVKGGAPIDNIVKATKMDHIMAEKNFLLLLASGQVAIQQ